MEEEQLTRRDVLKGLSKFIGTAIFIPSALIGTYSALENDFERAGLIPKKDDYKVRKCLLGGAVSAWLIYYGTHWEI